MKQQGGHSKTIARRESSPECICRIGHIGVCEFGSHAADFSIQGQNHEHDIGVLADRS
jgi:hypothetical protein